ncbi:uncharacterized protein [Macrobrachium rosenbergii]|uniref:uncharacterized protein n=1 Tax=Macrobrachium rosenbergii TaxID=79674 RepID=UPI0034D6C3F9
MLNGQVLNATAPFFRKANDSEAIKIAGGGRLVLGSDLDSAEGDFSLLQVAKGEIANFLFYDAFLEPQALIDFASCQTKIEGLEPLYQFSSSWPISELRGKAERYSAPVETVCRTHKASHFIILFPHKMTFSEASQWCEVFEGSLEVPESREEHRESVDLAEKFVEECTSACQGIYWLGLRGNVSSQTWLRTDTGETPPWQNFMKNEPIVGSWTCAAVQRAAFGGSWTRSLCDYATCPICRYEQLPTLRLLGLCSSSEFDSFYALRHGRDGRPEFIGHFSTIIRFSGEKWRMTLTSTESGILALSDPGPLHGYPIGRRRWTIAGDRCQRGELQATLLFTLCDESQYTCDDGSCVPYEQRCDHKTQCQDFSDEKGCSVIILPQGYSMAIPPPVSSDDPLELFFCQEIISVREVNIAEFRVQIDVRQTVKWRDARLNFRNLRPGDFSNRVKPSEGLWLPEFYIESGDQSLADSNVKTSFLVVQLNSDPLYKDATSQDELFDGKQNTIMMIQRSTISFSCQFNLLRYPFDTQFCSVRYSEMNAIQHINYTIESVSFEGNRKLLEYKVTGVTAELMRDKLEVIKIELVFQNQYGYYICNAFLPSLLLAVISYLTFFFDKDDFQDRIMVSLTSLLVLTGLLTQASQSVPKTTYMKTIDVWYAALIIFDFCIVVTLAVVEFLHRQEQKNNPSEDPRVTKHFQHLRNAAYSDGKKKNVIPVVQNFVEEVAPNNDGKSRSLLVNKFAVIVFPVAGVLFLSFFLCLAFQII